MRKIKRITSVILAALMIVSLFAAVPMTVNAAPPDSGSGTGTGGSTTVITPAADGDYLTFTAEEDNSSVTLKYTGGTLQYKNNNSDWASYTAGTWIDLASAGDSVRFRGKDTTFNYSNHVSIGGKVACSGNVMSLRLDEDGEVQGLSDGCFSYMFADCTGLTAAPELPETTLANNCYNTMFGRCTSLTTAPELPAKMLASNCYYSMFKGCESLTTAPELPATTLAESCYSQMFSGCGRLTTAPELPATTLALRCYERMFNRCMSLTTAPELPATELAEYCYCYMFVGCSNIKLSETQTAEYSIPYSVPSGRDGTTAPPTALSGMFAGTRGTFTGTPEINKTYYRPAKKYTVTWKNDDGTTIDTTSVYEGDVPTHADPTKAEDANYTYTFAGWTDGTNTYAANELPAVTGDATYTAVYTADPKGINYGGDEYIKPDDKIAVSNSDEGKIKFGLNLDNYLNMQMLGIQKKNAIATQGGDDGIRFVTAVNSKLLQGSNIEDYGYIVVKAKEGTPVADIYSKMDNLTYDKVANSPKNIFSCYRSSNTISGDFGKFSTNTDYKYVTLSLTNTSGSTDTVAARFYVKTKDNKFYYADYIDGNGVTHGGMAFTLPIESNSLV